MSWFHIWLIVLVLMLLYDIWALWYTHSPLMLLSTIAIVICIWLWVHVGH